VDSPTLHCTLYDTIQLDSTVNEYESSVYAYFDLPNTSFSLSESQKEIFKMNET